MTTYRVGAFLHPIVEEDTVWLKCEKDMTVLVLDETVSKGLGRGDIPTGVQAGLLLVPATDGYYSDLQVGDIIPLRDSWREA